jgi:D-alanine-D-alanine ligase
MKKIKVGIVFGGKSAEHSVSLISAKSIWENLDKERYEPVLIYINRAGEWCLTANTSFEEKAYSNEKFKSFMPWLAQGISALDVDIYFPMLHGPNGEDGRIQGLFELAGKPFVGADSLSSQLAMDKIVAKILFAKAGLKMAEYLYFTDNNHEQISELVSKKLSFPVFVKPCSLGSAVGISKARDKDELLAAVDLAFTYDNKIIIEQAVSMREIEISVMGNNELMISNPGELLPSREFYDYADKYLLGKTQFRIPVQLGAALETKIKEIARKAYRSLFLNGYARVDMFLVNGSDDIYINEINTIPGFTSISMFPKLWQAQGISFSQLLDRLIDYGFEYFKKRKENVDEGLGR